MLSIQLANLSRDPVDFLCHSLQLVLLSADDPHLLFDQSLELLLRGRPVGGPGRDVEDGQTFSKVLFAGDVLKLLPQEPVLLSKVDEELLLDLHLVFDFVLLEIVRLELFVFFPDFVSLLGPQLDFVGEFFVQSAELLVFLLAACDALLEVVDVGLESLVILILLEEAVGELGLAVANGEVDAELDIEPVDFLFGLPDLLVVVPDLLLDGLESHDPLALQSLHLVFLALQLLVHLLQLLQLAVQLLRGLRKAACLVLDIVEVLRQSVQLVLDGVSSQSLFAQLVLVVLNRSGEVGFEEVILLLLLKELKFQSFNFEVEFFPGPFGEGLVGLERVVLVLQSPCLHVQIYSQQIGLMNIQIKKKTSRTQCQSHQVVEKDKYKRVLLISPCNAPEQFIKDLLGMLVEHGVKVCHSEFEINEFCLQSLNKFESLNHQTVDFIVVVGGQEYVKATSFILQREHIPPVISIMEPNTMLGSVQMHSWKSQLQTILNSYQRCFMITEHLFRFKIGFQTHSVNVLSQIVIKRASIHCVTINIYVNEELFTSTVGDGLVIATPLGSTGYALCCGGAIINYLSKSIMLVGINPLTLSFRPIILLQNEMLDIQVASQSRGQAVMQVDGLLSVQWPRGKRYRISSGSQFMMVRQDTTGKCLKKLKEIYNWNGGYSK